MIITQISIVIVTISVLIIFSCDEKKTATPHNTATGTDKIDEVVEEDEGVEVEEVIEEDKTSVLENTSSDEITTTPGQIVVDTTTETTDTADDTTITAVTRTPTRISATRTLLGSGQTLPGSEAAVFGRLIIGEGTLE